GPNTWVLGGKNTYSGTTAIHSGTLQLSVNNALPTGTALILDKANGAVFDLNGNTQTIASLADGIDSGGVSSVTLGSSTLMINGSATTSDSGVISGSSGSLTWSGSGNQTLAGANIYTGTTSVSSGTLQVTGTLAATSSVSISGGTFTVGNSFLVASLTQTNGT